MRARWGEVARSTLGQGHALLAAALTETQPIALAGGTLTLAAPPSRSATFADAAHQRVLQRILEQTFGHSVQISVSSTGSDAAEVRVDRYRAAEEHPLVRALRSQLDADITARELIDEATWREHLAVRRQLGQRALNDSRPPTQPRSQP